MIPLADLSAQYHSIKTEIDAAVLDVLECGRFILGPNVTAIETEIAHYLGVKHAIGVASGTDALVIALRSAGLGPGDEVIVPAYTFFATAGAVLLVGAKPVFVDIVPETYCMNIEQVADRISSKTKAIIPVHLYGHPADMNQICDLAKGHGLVVIDDNAQAFGSEYYGRKSGSLGDMGCLSFFPTKNLGGYGDGGMVVTQDDELAEKVRMLRMHGWKKKYHPEMLGYNSRLDELQAAILRVKLNHVDQWNKQRREIAQIYSERLSKIGITTPVEIPNCLHVYHLYVIRVPNRLQVQQSLTDGGVSSGVYYPQPIHLTHPCQSLGHRPGDFPEAERASQETLALPLYPEMTTAQIETVLSSLEHAIAHIKV